MKKKKFHLVESELARRHRESPEIRAAFKAMIEQINQPRQKQTSIHNEHDPELPPAA